MRRIRDTLLSISIILTQKSNNNLTTLGKAVRHGSNAVRFVVA